MIYTITQEGVGGSLEKVAYVEEREGNFEHSSEMTCNIEFCDINRSNFVDINRY